MAKQKRRETRYTAAPGVYVGGSHLTDVCQRFNVALLHCVVPLHTHPHSSMTQPSTQPTRNALFLRAHIRASLLFL